MFTFTSFLFIKKSIISILQLLQAICKGVSKISLIQRRHSKSGEFEYHYFECWYQFYDDKEKVLQTKLGYLRKLNEEEYYW